MKWQPIDTAPKDGTWILLFGGEDYDDEQVAPLVCAQFDDEKSYDYEGINYHYWRYANWETFAGSFYVNPTHWMPLPPLPEPPTE